MRYVIYYRLPTGVEGRISLAIPDTDLPQNVYVDKMGKFLDVLEALNINLRKNEADVMRSIEKDDIE